MRSFVWSLVFLAVLLLALYGYMVYLDHASENLLLLVDGLDAAAREEDWEKAEAEVQEIADAWEKTVPRFALFTDHGVLDDVMQTIAELKGYLRFREEAEFMAETETLRALIEHIPKREALTIYNIF